MRTYAGDSGLMRCRFCDWVMFVWCDLSGESVDLAYRRLLFSICRRLFRMFSGRPFREPR